MGVSATGGAAAGSLEAAGMPLSGVAGLHGPGSWAVPTAYLLTCPAVASGQFGQRRRGTEVVGVQHRAAGAGDVKEFQVAGEEALDGGLVGGVQDRPAGAAAPRDLITQL